MLMSLLGDPMVDTNNSIAQFFQLFWPSLLLFYYIYVKNPTWVILCQFDNYSRLLNVPGKKHSTTLTVLTITSCPLPSSWCLRFSGNLYMSVVHLFFYSSIGLFNTLSSLLNMPKHFPPLSVFSRLFFLLTEKIETEKNFYKLPQTHLSSYLTSVLSSITWVDYLRFNLRLIKSHALFSTQGQHFGLCLSSHFSHHQFLLLQWILLTTYIYAMTYFNKQNS